MLDAENITPDDWDDGLNSEVPSGLFVPFPDIQMFSHRLQYSSGKPS